MIPARAERCANNGSACSLPASTPNLIVFNMTSKLSLKDPTLLRDACLVAGEWIAADSGGTIAVDNPSTGAVVGHVPNMGAAEARRAIEFANTALPAWRARTAKERAGVLRRW